MEISGISRQSVIIPLAVIITVIIFVGVISNLFVIAFFGIKRGAVQNLSTYHLFIALLTVSDLLSCIWGFMCDGTQLIFGKWIYGDFLCSTLTVFKSFFVFISHWIVTGMALERYRGIVYPFCRNFKKKEVFIFGGIVVFSGLALHSPLPMALSSKDGLCTFSSLYLVFSRREYLILSTYLIIRVLLQTVAPLLVTMRCFKMIKDS